MSPSEKKKRVYMGQAVMHYTKSAKLFPSSIYLGVTGEYLGRMEVLDFFKGPCVQDRKRVSKNTKKRKKKKLKRGDDGKKKIAR